MRLSAKTKWIPYVFILPFLLSFFLFFIIPSIYSFILSFAKYAGYGDIKWVAIRNYENILKYGRFWNAFGRTMFYWLAKFIPVTIISFLLAVCLHSKAVGKMSRLYKPIIFLPQICAVVAAALVFRVLFATNTGAINHLFGVDIAWLENPVYAKWTVLLLLCWRGIGWFVVVYLSGLSSISPDIQEAALIDGANAYQRTIRITIPLMKEIFLFAFIMDAISSLRMFTEAAVLTAYQDGGEALESAEGIINLMISNLKAGNFGMASAYGWILFLVIFVVSMFIFRLFRDREEATV